MRIPSTYLGVSLFALCLALLTLPGLAAESDGKAQTKQVVNINQAEETQLALLPRVGPALASRIATFREKNGKFENPEDLMLVRGIGEKTYALMEPYVVTSGETTLREKVRSSPE